MRLCPFNLDIKMFENETINYDEFYSNLFPKIIMAVSLAFICILGVIGKFCNYLLTKEKIFFFCCCLIGNLIVLIVAFRKQNYRCVTNCYIINLAITDLLFLLISMYQLCSLAFSQTMSVLFSNIQET